MPIISSLGALTYARGAQTVYPGSRYLPSTTGPGAPTSFYYYGTLPTNLVNLTSSTGFTLEYRIRYNTLAGFLPLSIGNFYSLGSYYWGVQVNSSGSVSMSGSWGSVNTANNVVTTAQWTALAFVCTPVGSNISISVYKNGVIQNIKKNNAGIFDTAWTFPASAFTYNVGGNFSFSPINQTPSQTCYIDEVRVSNINRYTTSYTIATQPFTPDSSTQMLLHFNYDTVYGINTPIVDSSQNALGAPDGPTLIVTDGSQANATQYVF